MESGGIGPPFFTSAIDRGEWPASRPCRLIPWETVPLYPLYGGPGGAQSRSGRYEGEINLFPLPGIENLIFGRTARSLVAIQTKVSRLLDMIIGYINLHQFVETHCSQ
jgi:hypothetical protein